MIAVQRTDGTFVDVRADGYTASFRRPSLEAFQRLQTQIANGKLGAAFLEFAMACANNEAAAKRLFEEWPGATATVSSALVEMVTPRVHKVKGLR